MKVLFINNSGGGFADNVDVAEGTTVGQFFEKKMLDCSPEDVLIRVNRMPVTSDVVLFNGDRVSMTPTKIEGA